MKIVSVLSQLNQVERNRFKKFLESPYFNANNDLISLFTALDKDIRNNRKIDKKSTWKRIFRQEPFNDAKWRKSLTTLFDFMEKFIGLEMLLEDQTGLSNFCLKKSIDKNLPEMVEYSLKRIERNMANEPQYAIDTQLKNISYIRNRIDRVSDFERKQEVDKIEGLRDDLIKLNDALDNMYLQEKLRIAWSFENFKNAYLYDIEDTITFEEHVLSMSENLTSKGSKGVQIYRRILFSYKDSEEISFIEDLYEELKSQSTTFSSKESKDIYMGLINKSIRKVNSGASEYESMLLDLWQFGLENELLYENGILDPGLYRNIAATAAKLKEYDWALQFIEEKRVFLEAKHQETAYSFNKARILANMGRYDELVEILRDVEYEDLTYNLNSKLLLMVAYYELEEYYVLDSFIKSFKVFLRRKRNIPKSRKDAFYGFTNVLYHILMAQERFDPKRIKLARKELSEVNTIPNRIWLTEKIIHVEDLLKIRST